MRNRALHDALRDFALEAAALLSDDLKAGAEVEFDVVDEGDRRGPVLYRYQPRTGAFIGGRWERLRELPALPPRLHGAGRGCRELAAGQRPARRAGRAGAAGDARAALRGRHQLRLPRGALRARLQGGRDDALPRRCTRPRRRAARGRLDGGRADRLRRGPLASSAATTPTRRPRPSTPSAATAPRRSSACSTATWRPTSASARATPTRACARLVTALRLWRPASVSLGAPGWRRTDHGRWSAVPVGGTGAGRGNGWQLPAGEETALREFVAAIEGDAVPVARSPGRSRASRWAASARATRRRSPTCCSRCAGCSTPPATPARRASRCGWPRSAPRRAGAARCRVTSSRPYRSSGC